LYAGHNLEVLMGKARIGAGVGALGIGLGCAGLPAEAPPRTELLTLRSEQKECLMELVGLPGGKPRLLARVPGRCHDWELVLSKDGARVLLPSAQHEVDLATHEVRELPPLDVLNRQHTLEQVLDYDTQGAPTWRVRLGEGQPEWVEGEGQVYPQQDERRYVLRDGGWVQQDGVVAVSGRRLHPTLVELDGVRDVTEPELQKTLALAAGSEPEAWKIREPLAWGARDEGEAGWTEPVLLQLHGQWRALPKLGVSFVALEVHDHWLRVASFPKEARVVDLATGEVVWSGEGPAVFWPADLPLPSL
jgi:hypothetical protein